MSLLATKRSAPFFLSATDSGKVLVTLTAREEETSASLAGWLTPAGARDLATALLAMAEVADTP